MKNYDTAAAVACLGGVFLDILKGGDIGLSGFEREAVLVGHMTIVFGKTFFDVEALMHGSDQQYHTAGIEESTKRIITVQSTAQIRQIS